jgi:hypothetical protein
MRNKLLTLGAALFAAITTAHAQPTPCPDCPPCTNCPPYTNPPPVIQEYPLDTVLVRVASVLTPGFVQVYTNYGWMVDSSNLLVSAGASPFDSATAAPYGNLYYNIAVTNTDPTRAYTIQWTTDLASTNWSDLGGIFIGTTNNSEYTVQMVGGPNIPGVNLFWRAYQQPGFVAWVHAATNGFNGGTAGGCPGTYHGYVNWAYMLPTWGLTPDTNQVHHTATDLLEPTNSLEFFTDYGYYACNSNTVDWVTNANNQLYGTRARFSVFFKTYPTNQPYPLYFRNYLQPTNDITPHIAGLPSSGTKSKWTVQPFKELSSDQMKALGLTTNDLMTGKPDDN